MKHLYLYIGLLKSCELGLIEISQDKTNYHRVEMGPVDWGFNGEVIYNITEVLFPLATISWGVVAHFGIFDSLQGGNILAVGTLGLGSVTNIHKDIQIKFKGGKLTIDMNLLELEIQNG